MSHEVEAAHGISRASVAHAQEEASVSSSCNDQTINLEADGTASRRKVAPSSVGPQDFELLSVIGRGAYGKVLQVRHKASQKIFAMKVLHKKYLTEKGQVSYTHVERQIMASVDHPYLVSLKFAFQTHERLYLVMNYCAGGELFYHLSQQGMMLEGAVKVYAAELVLAIEHLHKHGIVHRDLKPENILLKGNGHIAVTDYGMAKILSSEEATTKTICGTNEYMAPEMVARSVLKQENNSEKPTGDSPKTQVSENSTGHSIGRSYSGTTGARGGYGKPVDWWSLGALIYEMLTGKPPFQAHNSNKNPMKLYKKILSGKPPLPKYLSGSAHSLLKGLLTKNPDQRLGCARNTMFKIGGVSALKRHPFFEGIDWDRLAEEQVPPPIDMSTTLEGLEDTKHFDSDFTDERPCVSEATLLNDSSPKNRDRHASSECDENCDSFRLWRGFSFVATDDEELLVFEEGEGSTSSVQNGASHFSYSDKAEEQWMQRQFAQESEKAAEEKAEKEVRKTEKKNARKDRTEKREADRKKYSDDQIMYKENGLHSERRLASKEEICETKPVTIDRSKTTCTAEDVSSPEYEQTTQNGAARNESREMEAKNTSSDRQFNNRLPTTRDEARGLEATGNASIAKYKQEVNTQTREELSKQSSAETGASHAISAATSAQPKFNPDASEWIPLAARKAHSASTHEAKEETYAHAAPSYPHKRWWEGIQPQSHHERSEQQHFTAGGGGERHADSSPKWTSQRTVLPSAPQGAWARVLSEGSATHFASDPVARTGKINGLTTEDAQKKWDASASQYRDASKPNSNSWITEALESSNQSKKKKGGKKMTKITFGAPRMR
eukprot:gb/GECG01001622.1/.p1 GENE.gb/GECG01001622.1/~~gb/GECG01001622.1/.p1  ORF type:complete len:838 (+),score=134.16 gb/GECG01001622.1/:1-2514(+)